MRKLSIRRYYTPAGHSLKTLMLETFRLNGRLLSAGDRLVSDHGLTSARWQILGAIALAGQSLTVSDIARRMGLTRQAVQRVVNELYDEGFLKFLPNPEHKRAKLTALTRRGEAAYQGAMDAYAPWVNELAAALDETSIRKACALLRTLSADIERGEKFELVAEEETQ